MGVRRGVKRGWENKCNPLDSVNMAGGGAFSTLKMTRILGIGGFSLDSQISLGYSDIRGNLRIAENSIGESDIHSQIQVVLCTHKGRKKLI